MTTLRWTCLFLLTICLGCQPAGESTTADPASEAVEETIVVEEDTPVGEGAPDADAATASGTPATSAGEPTEVATTAGSTASPPPAAPASGAVAVDPELPEYKPVSGISGNLKSIGSDTMNNLMTLWLEGFKKFYPGAQLEIEGKGSSTAPPALIEGTAAFGPMSRPMKDTEIAEFEGKFGYKPTGLKTCIDVLAVYVHKDNPIKALTLQEVDAIFSKTRKGGLEKDIRTWGDVGLSGEWADKPISLYGRNSASGTYGFFKEHALANGDYKDSVKEQPGSSSVVQGVASDKYGIGYSGIGYKTADVRAVPLALGAGEPAIEAAAEYAYTGEYPLSRFLLVYINYAPGSELDPLRREFIRYIFSRNGQEDVVKDGYIPVTEAVAHAEVESVGVHHEH